MMGYLLRFLFGFGIINAICLTFVGFVMVVFAWICGDNLGIDAFRCWVGVSILFGVPIGIFVGSSFANDTK